MLPAVSIGLVLSNCVTATGLNGAKEVCRKAGWSCTLAGGWIYAARLHSEPNGLLSSSSVQVSVCRASKAGYLCPPTSRSASSEEEGLEGAVDDG